MGTDSAYIIMTEKKMFNYWRTCPVRRENASPRALRHFSIFRQKGWSRSSPPAVCIGVARKFDIFHLFYNSPRSTTKLFAPANFGEGTIVCSFRIRARVTGKMRFLSLVKWVVYRSTCLFLVWQWAMSSPGEIPIWNCNSYLLLRLQQVLKGTIE